MAAFCSFRSFFLTAKDVDHHAEAEALVPRVFLGAPEGHQAGLTFHRHVWVGSCLAISVVKKVTLTLPIGV